VSTGLQAVTVSGQSVVPEGQERVRVPRISTTLIGRHRERTAIAEILLQSETQLLTLTGTGGIGKTRLAIQCAFDLADQFPDGVVFVALSALSEQDQVPAAIANALGVSLVGARSDSERVAEALASRRLLLVLDNLEHLLDFGPTLAELLRFCPDVIILATSRSPLNVSDEREFEILPLSLPDIERRTSTAEIARADAVALFVQRARAVRPAYALTEENARAVAEICHRLDGLPLAIELAAVRSKVLDPTAMLARLAVSLDLLTDGPRDAPDRLQTLRTAVAWSHDLLEEKDRVFFRRIAVFPGSFTLDAAAAIVLDGESDADVAVIERIESLVDMSLLRQVEAEGPETRFLMLRTIREFGRECLAEAGEVSPIRDRHLDWCLAMAQDIEDHFFLGDHWDWVKQLVGELDNVREALVWAAQTDPIDRLPRLISMTWNAWYAGASMHEGSGWLARALAQDKPLDPLVTVKNLVGAGYIAVALGDFDRARAIFAQARPLAVTVSPQRWLGMIDFGLGRVEQAQARPEESRQYFESALETFRQGNAKDMGVGLALNYLGLAAASLGDGEGGRRILNQALELNRSGGHPWGTTLSLRFLGQLAKDAGDLNEATRCFQEALCFDVLSGQGWHVAAVLEGLADVSYRRRQASKAARLLGAAERIRAEIGVPVYPAMLADHKALVASVRGSLGEAAFTKHWQNGSRLSVAEVISDESNDQSIAESASMRLAKMAGLTRRELDILQLVAAGKSTREVSEVANISPRTVATHLSNIYTKFNVNDRGAAVARAYQLDLVNRYEDAGAEE
jgi:predicted ATPase/DNA-binding CsgD family transcriptional regulator